MTIEGTVRSYDRRTGIAQVDTDKGVMLSHIIAIYGDRASRFPEPGDKLVLDLKGEGHFRPARYVDG